MQGDKEVIPYAVEVAGGLFGACSRAIGNVYDQIPPVGRGHGLSGAVYDLYAALAALAASAFFIFVVL